MPRRPAHKHEDLSKIRCVVSSFQIVNAKHLPAQQHALFACGHCVCLQMMQHRYGELKQDSLVGSKSDSLQLAASGSRSRSNGSVVDDAPDQSVGRDTLDCVDVLEHIKAHLETQCRQQMAMKQCSRAIKRDDIELTE